MSGPWRAALSEDRLGGIFGVSRARIGRVLPRNDRKAHRPAFASRA